MRNAKPPIFRPSYQPDADAGSAARLAAWRQKRAREGKDAPAPEKATLYGEDWKRVRAAVLAAEPHCRMCAESGILRPAKLVDHIQTVRARPDLRLVTSNLQPLCWPCHNAKTNRHDGGFGRPVRR